MERRGAVAAALAAALIYFVNAVSPPALMDDVDAVQAQIARNMLDSGDWVTARLNGIVYLEKAPGPYWMMAASYAVFGVRDWAARLPFAISAVGLAWVTALMGGWAFGARAGMFAGLSVGCSVGLWLFTRIAIPDVTLTLAVALAMWALLRFEETSRRWWAWLFWVSMGAGFLLKGLIAVVFPAAAAALYMAMRRKCIAIWTGWWLAPLIAAPWVWLAMARNPPLVDFTMRSAPGEYHGFFWFFFLNEHLFRFLNMRWPRDYNTVSRPLFWLLHIAWLFPWSAYLPEALRKLPGRGESWPDRMRLLCWCWAGFILVFFTFSTTQEYYSMPAYPALALLLGDALTRTTRWTRWGERALAGICAALAVSLGGIWWMVRGMEAPGDISRALTSNPEAYTLSLGHLKDLTLPAFAYLKGPLLLAMVAFSLGAAAAWRRWRLALAGMLILFTFAARTALTVFDPYLSSRALAEALLRSPVGEVVVENQYYAFSSVFFYAHERMAPRAWLLNGRVNNLEYGSYAPGSPDVFLDDRRFAEKWRGADRVYLLVEAPRLARIEELLGAGQLHRVAEAGGKYLLVNRP